MSAETFTTAMFLITAVIAAGVLINAVFPVIYQMQGTFSSATHESDVRLRTDIKIVATFANTNGETQVWLKNIGSQRIAEVELQSGDVFFGPVGNFERLSVSGTNPPGSGQWYPNLIDQNGNGFWDTGETLEIKGKTSKILAKGDPVYFQFVLPNGIWRSTEYTVS
jgi:flagellar protein FlaG